jgi:hypothetical protein
MRQLDFNFGNALMHFNRTGGPKGFLWKFVLGYAGLSLLIQLISYWFQAPIYALYYRIFTEGGGDISAYLPEINAVSMRANLVSLFVLPFALLLWVMFEAASQRRYMRGEAFRLRLGADEGRIFVVGLFWVMLAIGGYIGLLFLIIIPALLGMAFGPVVSGILVLIGLLAGMALALWFFARFSPASAMTIRDGQIRFFEAWRATRGRGLALVGIVLVQWLLMALLMGIPLAIGAVIGVTQLGPLFADGAPSWEVLTGAMTAPGFWVPMLVVGLLTGLLGASLFHIAAGPAALAAKTDPNWVGQPGVTDTFA